MKQISSNAAHNNAINSDANKLRFLPPVVAGAVDKNPLAVRPAASQQSDSAVIGPTGQARLGLADDPRRLYGS
jgi:hypothetical protein